MLVKNIEFSGHQRNTKTEFSQKAHVSRFTAIHHLKAEIRSMFLGPFFDQSEGITYM